MEVSKLVGNLIEFNDWYKFLSDIKRRYELIKNLNYGVVKFSDGKEFDLSLDKSIEMYEKLIKELITYQIEDAEI